MGKDEGAEMKLETGKWKLAALVGALALVGELAWGSWSGTQPGSTNPPGW